MIAISPRLAVVAALWRKAKPSLKRTARRLERLLAIIGLGMILYNCCFDVSVIVSRSMSPTLQGTSPENGDWVLTERITYLFRDPDRWEVVAFDDSGGDHIMKRVVGLPGESIGITDEYVVRDTEKLTPPEPLDFLEYIAYGNVHNGKQVACEDGFYVLGDYQRDSNDSRFEGAIRPQQITGRALVRVWPPSRWGFVR